jgi:hypothetical protein
MEQLYTLIALVGYYQMFRAVSNLQDRVSFNLQQTQALANQTKQKRIEYKTQVERLYLYTYEAIYEY